MKVLFTVLLDTEGGGETKNLCCGSGPIFNGLVKSNLDPGSSKPL